MATADWLASVSSEVHVSSGSTPGRSAARRARRRSRAPAAAAPRAMRAPAVPPAAHRGAGRPALAPRSAIWVGAPLVAAAADERLVEADARLPQRGRRDPSLGAVARAQARTAPSPCRARRSSRRRRPRARRRGDDRRQHVVDVEARADRLADLAQGPQLVDRARQVPCALLQGAEQLDVLDGDRALRRERGEHVDRCGRRTARTRCAAARSRPPRDRRRAWGHPPSTVCRRARRPGATRTRGRAGRRAIRTTRRSSPTRPTIVPGVAAYRRAASSAW